MVGVGVAIVASLGSAVTTAPPGATGVAEAARTIAILILPGATSSLPLTEVYGAARRALERGTTLTVAPLEAVGAEERDGALRACAGDAACFVRELRAARDEVDLLLTVGVDRPGIDLLVGLRLIDTRGGFEIGALGAEVSGDPSLDAAFDRCLPEVFPASVWGEVASIAIRTSPVGVEATIGGRSCVTPCQLDRLPPGPGEVVVWSAGRESARRPVLLERGRTVELELDLAPPAAPLYESPWLWLGIGIAVAGGIVGALAAAAGGSDRERVLCFAASPEACEP